MKVVIIIREPGRQKPEFSLEFELPQIPSVGDYISIFRPDAPNHSEDIVVRHIWWLLSNPETAGFAVGNRQSGQIREVFVECDMALGPYARDQWRETVTAARSRGVDVEEFELTRLSIRESELKR